MTPPVHTAAIVGLGLIGGSLARDLAALGIRVLAHDADPGTVRAARREGIVAGALGPGLEGVEVAEAVIVAVPVAAAPTVLAILAPRVGGARLITDAGSTKRSILAAAARLGLGRVFVGAHPLAGDHRSGWGASRPGLFRGARVFLTPAPDTGEDPLRLAHALWAGVGAAPEVSGAAEHDARLAWTSHLPQAVCTALAVALSRRGISPSELGPGGRDASRLAGSDPEMWTAIALDNARELAPALAGVEAALGALRQALERGDQAEVRRLFEAGRRWTAPPAGMAPVPSALR